MNANGRRILVCCVALGCLFLLVTLQTDTQWPAPITPTTREAVERQPNASTTSRSDEDDRRPVDRLSRGCDHRKAEGLHDSAG
ncbi:hypothetical protein M3Y99_00023000 [Aphelenchoides fujianensis]|nr:hypothetical protein M3Y99_00023000 [Aphelenchoides fujianensis]